MNSPLPISRDVHVFIADIEDRGISKGIEIILKPISARHSQFKFWLALFMLCGNTRAAFPTTVSIVYNADQIIVAADSLVYRGTPPKVCKIFKVGRIYWAMSGLTGVPSTNYDVAKIVKNVYRPTLEISDVAKQFKSSVKIPLTKTAEYLYRNGPKTFLLFKNHPLEIAFWGFDGGAPVVANISYQIEVVGGKISLRIVDDFITDCRRESCSNGRGLVIGAKTYAVNYFKTHPRWPENLPQAAVDIVSLEIDREPATVGPPISELIVTHIGYQWTKPNDCCNGEPKEGPIQVSSKFD